MANKNFIDINNLKIVWKNIDNIYSRKNDAPQEILFVYKISNELINTEGEENDIIIYVNNNIYQLYIKKNSEWVEYDNIDNYKLFIFEQESTINDTIYNKDIIYIWNGKELLNSNISNIELYTEII